LSQTADSTPSTDLAAFSIAFLQDPQFPKTVMTLSMVGNEVATTGCITKNAMIKAMRYFMVVKMLLCEIEQHSRLKQTISVKLGISQSFFQGEIVFLTK